MISLPVRILKRTDSDSRDHPTSELALQEVEALKFSGLRVLAVDDEGDARDLIRRVLEEVGIHVKLAESAAEAFSAVQTDPLDLIISDIGMPQEDGYTLIRRIRDWELACGSSRIPAIALTAYARPADRQRALLGGFQAHMAKPVEALDLLTTLASLTGRIR